MFYTSLQYLKASSEGSFLRSSFKIKLQHFFRLFGYWYVKGLHEYSFREYILRSCKYVRFHSMNYFVDRISENFIEILRGYGQKIRQMKNKTNSFTIWVKPQQFESFLGKSNPSICCNCLL